MFIVRKNSIGIGFTLRKLEATAQGGEGASGQKSGSKSNIHCITSGVPNFATGNYIVFKPAGSNPGAASVSPSSWFRMAIYQKTIDESGVGIGGSSGNNLIYNITYKATYTVSGASAGSIDFLDGQQVNF